MSEIDEKDSDTAVKVRGTPRKWEKPDCKRYSRNLVVVNDVFDCKRYSNDIDREIDEILSGKGRSMKNSGYNVDGAIMFLGLVTFGVFGIIQMVGKGILNRAELSMEHKIKKTRIAIGAVISLLSLIPFLHFLVYLTTPEHWAAWYLLLALTQGAVWYMTTAPRGWYLD